MIKKQRTKEEWKQIVDDFIPDHQTQKAYCKENNIKYGTFKNWYPKLKAKEAIEKTIEWYKAEDKILVMNKQVSNYLGL